MGNTPGKAARISGGGHGRNGPPKGNRRGTAEEDNAMQDHIGTASDRTEPVVVTAARNLLATKHPEIPAQFVRALLSEAAAEDLADLDVRALASLLADAWGLLSVRAPGTPKVRLATPPADSRLDAGSVLEVVNDDMPFLFDSVL